jgi:hypothetical protein
MLVSVMTDELFIYFLGLAIVGGGIGGIATAYWLKYYLNDSIAITIYESKQVCQELKNVYWEYIIFCRLAVD